MKKIFKRKKLLIIAGPTGCGKTTFRNSVKTSQRPNLTKTILEKAFLRNFSNIKTLRMKGLRRQFWKDKSFWELSQDHINFILQLDTTCPLTVETLILLPAFIKDFDQILVVHLYTPIEVWIERIRERRLNGFKTSNHVNQILKAHQATKQKVSKAQSLYYACYSNFEYYFSGLGVKKQMCINTLESVALAKPYPFNCK